MRNTSIATLKLAQLLVGADGMVPVHHKVGKCTRWLVEEGRQTLDPTSVTHDFRIPLASLQVRSGSDAGGDFIHLVTPSRGKSWFDIVRTEGGSVEVLATIPEAVAESLEITLTTGELLTIRAGETAAKVTVINAAKHIHDPENNVLGMASLNSKLLYDQTKITFTHEVKDSGRLIMGHKDLPNWMN
ncbi:hypothetical protein MZD04_gp160 [Pseudomonas phage Psa21]|uniref:Uncharacterized protein n=1 Tax=Pseudomonas phage Psa21 TaxID=2530023 RepID=A0A481W5Z7_9CAUD|nr:hypothetical protein MZD04_gp160 [Pseudomonas phage Psa21]QBJ02687.1 hypothetical protein PSA21_160 [Pseudomonas phage Psa21]